MSEGYPSNWWHATIHLNPETGEMHSDGEHAVRGWILSKLDELADLRAQLVEANKRIEVLEGKLRFYANKSNWYKKNPSRDPYATVRYPSKAEQDSGERAREVLEWATR